VLVSLAGKFPGSPITLQYEFTIESKKIAGLESADVSAGQREPPFDAAAGSVPRAEHGAWRAIARRLVTTARCPQLRRSARSL